MVCVRRVAHGFTVAPAVAKSYAAPTTAQRAAFAEMGIAGKDTANKARSVKVVNGVVKQAGFVGETLTGGNKTAQLLIPLWLLFVTHAIGIW